MISDVRLTVNNTYEVPSARPAVSYSIVISFAASALLTAPELLYKMVVIGKKPDPRCLLSLAS